MKRDPLLTADTVKPELFNMQSFIDRVNAHAHMAKLEKDVDDAQRRCDALAESLNASSQDLRGKTIQQFGHTYDGGMMLVFTDGTYVKMCDGKETESYGVDFVYPSTDDAVKFGIVPSEMQAEYEHAKTLLCQAQLKGRLVRDADKILRDAVSQLGKAAVESIIKSI